MPPRARLLSLHRASRLVAQAGARRRRNLVAGALVGRLAVVGKMALLAAVAVAIVMR